MCSVSLWASWAQSRTINSKCRDHKGQFKALVTNWAFCEQDAAHRGGLYFFNVVSSIQNLSSATFLKSGLLDSEVMARPTFLHGNMDCCPFRRVSPHPHFIHSQYYSDRHYISNPYLKLFLNNLLEKNTNIWPELTQRSMSCTWGSLMQKCLLDQTELNAIHRRNPGYGFSILCPLGKLKTTNFDKGIL